MSAPDEGWFKVVYPPETGRPPRVVFGVYRNVLRGERFSIGGQCFSWQLVAEVRFTAGRPERAAT